MEQTTRIERIDIDGRACFIRYDIFKVGRGARVVSESDFSQEADRNKETNPEAKYNGEECSSCFLNHPHSLPYHKRAIKRYRESLDKSNSRNR